MADLQEIADAVILRPGDTLIVCVRSQITREMSHEIYERLEGELPGVKVLLINAEQLAVYRPGETDG